jgi:hypothetical protein
MPMVPPELGVGALKGRVTVRLRLLDTILALSQPVFSISRPRIDMWNVKLIAIAHSVSSGN